MIGNVCPVKAWLDVNFEGFGCCLTAIEAEKLHRDG